MRDLPSPIRRGDPPSPRLPSRTEIRQLAEDNHQARVSVAEAGGNVYQTSLDQMDKIQNYVALLPFEDGTLFLTMYNEECAAIVGHTQHRIEEINNRITELAAKKNTFSALNPRPLSEQSIGEKLARALGAAVLFSILLRACQ